EAAIYRPVLTVPPVHPGAAVGLWIVRGRRWKRLPGAAYRVPLSGYVGDPTPAERQMRLIAGISALLTFFVPSTLAAFQQESDWDVTDSHGPGKVVEFTTDEGTWMSVDVSPDGRQLVFDLVGDIYLLPIEGGTARLIRGGPAFETQPRFRPDGTRIAFTSDRGGLENLWVMNADGSELREVSHEKERQVSNPAWTPDGLYLVGRKHFRNTRSLGAGEMWLYHIAGGGGSQISERRNWEQNATEPVVSPAARCVYYSEVVSPG